MAQLEKVFAPEELHYEFYERLSTEEAVRRIEGFLGIDAAPADFGRRSNASPKSGGLSEAAMREVAQAYAPVYADAAARFDKAAARFGMAAIVGMHMRNHPVQFLLRQRQLQVIKRARLNSFDHFFNARPG